MADKSRPARTPGSRLMREEDIFAVLNESDGDFSADSDNDESYYPETGRNRPNRVISSSSDSNDEISPSDNVYSPTPFTEDSSIVLRRVPKGRARNSRRRRGRVVSGRVEERIGEPSIPITNSRDFCPTVTQLQSPNYIQRELENWEWFQFLDDYLDDDIFDLMVKATNQTSVLITQKNMALTVRKLKVFFGINMVMASINYPQIKKYWEKSWRIPLIADSMTRDRFFLIRTRQRLVEGRRTSKVVYDDDVTEEQRTHDRIWKVRPLFNRILKGCHIQDKTLKLSIDEMIIPFSGHCNIRQYCPNKPNPVGLKVFVLANPNGLICDMTVYQGETTFKSYRENGFSLGEAAVLQMTESLVPGHFIFFDRYFSSIKLLEELLNRGFNATETIMKNRFHRFVSLTPENSFIKKNRGASEIACLSNDRIAITRWLDNKPVLLISTCYANTTSDICKRWDKRQKRYVQVPRPEVIREYNQNMGGVDLADRMLSVCPSRSRTQKWTIRFICHMIDVCVVNAWFLFREVQIKKSVPLYKISQLREYKLRLGTKLIEENLLPPEELIVEAGEGFLRVQHIKRSIPIVPLPTVHKRMNRADHMPKIVDKRQRCRNNACGFKTDVVCSNCNIYLCLTKTRNCFATFHGHQM